MTRRSPRALAAQPTAETRDALQFSAAVRAVVPAMGDAALAAAWGTGRVLTLARGDALLRAGEPAVHAALVLVGFLREFFVLPDGTERTKAFALEGAFTGSLADLLSGRPSRAFIVAEEPTRVWVVPAAALAALGSAHAAWDGFVRRMTERLLLAKAEREFELLGLDAWGRYQALVQRHPVLEARVAARHVASYLGITPVHLSRLRRKRRTGAWRAGPARPR